MWMIAGLSPLIWITGGVSRVVEAASPAGVEFANYTNSFNKVALKKSFQFGFFYNNSYLLVKNYPINEYGFTGGISRSFKNGLMYGLSLEAGSRGTTQADLIKENYFQFTFSFSYKDIFLSKGRKYN